MELRDHDIEKEELMIMGSGNKLSDRNGVSEHVDETSRHGGHNGDVSRSGKGYIEGGRSGINYGSLPSHESAHEIGDLVWGKVKSHPWWPGHVYNEDYATPSVLRTKREGTVLVAFFGDSSYGWFEQSELISFDLHFAEKSLQANSKVFLKAIEEAMDEVSRRRGLGLACRCRNPYNFRPTNVQGYFAVDIADYEPGGLYSLNQIRKARDSFQPRQTLAFIKQMALTSTVAEQTSMDFTLNKATVLAYRKAVFEEFDETYAQAFGVQPDRATGRPIEAVGQSRAPFSGPLVVAETMGERKKSTSKPIKTKDNTKKDRYLFKRRDEQDNESRTTNKLHSGKANSIEGTVTSSTADYVLQKRTPPAYMRPQITANRDQTETVVSKEETPTVLKHRTTGTQMHVSKVDSAASLPVGHTSTYNPGLSVGEEDNMPQTIELDGGDMKHEPLSLRMNKLVQDFHLSPSPDADSKELDGRKGPKNVKILKRPVSESSADKHTLGEKKKKRKKELAMMGTGSDHTQKHVIAGKEEALGGKVSGKLVQGAPKEEFRVDQRKKDGTSALLLDDRMPMVETGNAELELPHLLSYLQNLALNPFCYTDENNLATIRSALLRFRSLVYSKSSEAEPSEVHEQGESTGDVSTSKPKKRPSLPDEPNNKVGRKRGPSDRQEEIAVKKLKKMNQLKTLTGEKKAVVAKTLEIQRGDEKEPTAAIPPPRPVKLGSTKKYESPSDPTALLMKFSPQTNLPSSSELRARLARFGPLDHSGTRVFYTTSTCKVIFMHRVDAQAALRHLMQNKALFGNIIANCFIRSLSEPEPVKVQTTEDGATPTKTPSAAAAAPANQALQQQSATQLKSCLKKSAAGEEIGSSSSSVVTGVNGKGTSRVKFMLGGEDVVRSEVGNKNHNMNININNASASFAADGASSSNATMEFNSKNFQKVIPPLPMPNPCPPQFSKGPNNMQSTEVASSSMLYGKPHNIVAVTKPTAKPQNVVAVSKPIIVAPSTNNNNVDIAPQMLGLLSRCNDVVNNVKKLLGYMPYHPL